LPGRYPLGAVGRNAAHGAWRRPAAGPGPRPRAVPRAGRAPAIAGSCHRIN